MKSETTKHLIILAFVALAAFIAWEIFKTIQKGEEAAKQLFAAPGNAIKGMWNDLKSGVKAVTGLFGFDSGGSGSSDNVSLVDPSSPLYDMTTIGGVPINTLGTNGFNPQPTGSQDVGFNNWLASLGAGR